MLTKSKTALDLLRDLAKNANSQSLKDFLYIECGFTEEEIDSWMQELVSVLAENE